MKTFYKTDILQTFTEALIHARITGKKKGSYECGIRLIHLLNGLR